MHVPVHKVYFTLTQIGFVHAKATDKNATYTRERAIQPHTCEIYVTCNLDVRVRENMLHVLMHNMMYTYNYQFIIHNCK